MFRRNVLPSSSGWDPQFSPFRWGYLLTRSESKLDTYRWSNLLGANWRQLWTLWRHPGRRDKGTGLIRNVQCTCPRCDHPCANYTVSLSILRPCFTNKKQKRTALLYPLLLLFAFFSSRLFIFSRLYSSLHIFVSLLFCGYSLFSSRTAEDVVRPLQEHTLSPPQCGRP
jgi:hypothetical protein